MTRDAASQLLDVLDELLKEYRTLLETSASKQEALQERDIDAVEKHTEQEEALSGQIQELNQKRLRVSRAIMNGDAPEDRSISLGELEPYLQPPIREELQERRSRLKNLVRDVQRITRENIGLLENRVTVFNQLFDRLTGSDEENETYDRGFEKENQKTDGPLFVDGVI